MLLRMNSSSWCEYGASLAAQTGHGSTASARTLHARGIPIDLDVEHVRVPLPPQQAGVHRWADAGELGLELLCAQVLGHDLVDPLLVLDAEIRVQTQWPRFLLDPAKVVRDGTLGHVEHLGQRCEVVVETLGSLGQ